MYFEGLTQQHVFEKWEMGTKSKSATDTENLVMTNWLCKIMLGIELNDDLHNTSVYH